MKETKLYWYHNMAYSMGRTMGRTLSTFPQPDKVYHCKRIFMSVTLQAIVCDKELLPNPCDEQIASKNRHLLKTVIGSEDARCVWSV